MQRTTAGRLVRLLASPLKHFFGDREMILLGTLPFDEPDCLHLLTDVRLHHLLRSPACSGLNTERFRRWGFCRYRPSCVEDVKRPHNQRFVDGLAWRVGMDAAIRLRCC